MAPTWLAASRPRATSCITISATANFEDVTKKAGVSGNGMFATGATAGDYDNDGFLDLFVTGYNSRQLFHNNGDGTFTDVTAKSGVAGAGWSSSAAWVDYDRDGYLDLYVVRYLDYEIKIAPYCGYKQEGYRMYCDPQQFDGVPDQLFHNNHDGTFTDVSRQGRHRQPRRQRARRGDRRYRPRWLARHLRHQRRRAQFPVPQQGRRHLPGHHVHLQHRVRHERQGDGRHGNRDRRFRRRRPPRHLPYRLFAGVQHAVPQPRQAAIRGRNA